MELMVEGQSDMESLVKILYKHYYVRAVKIQGQTLMHSTKWNVIVENPGEVENLLVTKRMEQEE